MSRYLTLGVSRPATVGANMPGIVATVLEIPNKTPACLSHMHILFSLDIEFLRQPLRKQRIYRLYHTLIPTRVMTLVVSWIYLLCIEVFTLRQLLRRSVSTSLLAKHLIGSKHCFCPSVRLSFQCLLLTRERNIEESLHFVHRFSVTSVASHAMFRSRGGQRSWSPDLTKLRHEMRHNRWTIFKLRPKIVSPLIIVVYI